MELEQLIEHVQEIHDEHDTCLNSDDQYEDPEQWWCNPLLHELQEAIDNMDSNS